MNRRTVLQLGLGMAATMVGGVERRALAQAPPFATRKVTDTVYIFRYQSHPSMFVVTPDSVIATDPIGYLRPPGRPDLHR